MKFVLKYLLVLLACIGCTTNDTLSPPPSTPEEFPFPQTILTANMVPSVRCPVREHYCTVSITFSTPWPEETFDVIVSGAEMDGGAAFSGDRKMLTIALYPGENIESRDLKITITSPSVEVVVYTQLNVVKAQ